MDFSLGLVGDIFIMGYDNQGLGPSMQVIEDTQNFSAALGIQIARRLIGQDYHWVIGQRPGDGNSLLLAAAEF
jgi:hypothetical protein